MNNKIIISISIIITIIVISFSLAQIENNNEQTSQFEKNDEINNMLENDEINNMLEKIKEDKVKNDNSIQPYKPKDREWVTKGPFSIDRSEYVLGEKIFVKIKNLDVNTKGQMIFTKIVNSTHIFEYKKIPFDGSKPQQNYYLGLELFKMRGICTADQLIGDWEFRILTENREYGVIEFRILDKYLPGVEEKYEPVC